jgi:hypothetical protein
MKSRIMGPFLSILVFVSTLGAQPTSSPSLRILFPKPASVVNNGTLIQATIEPKSAQDLFSGVHFSFSADGRKFSEITDAAPDGLAPYSVLWNAQSLAGGRYSLRVQAVPKNQENTRPLDQTISVLVNEQPRAVAKVTLLSEPHRVRFDASSSKDPDGRIVAYRWNFEDGTFADGVTAEHAYPGPGRYTFQLVVTDNLGGTGTTDHIFELHSETAIGKEQIFDKIKDGCGCTQMRILDGTKATNGEKVVGPAGLKFNLDSTGIPEAESTNLGGYNEAAVNGKLDLTKGPFRLQTRFEVVAQLAKESEPALCAEGQRVKRSTWEKGVTGDKSGKFSADPRYDSDKGADPYVPSPPAGTATPPTEGACGYSGDRWCDDDYHGGDKVSGEGKKGDSPPNGYKKYDGEERIVWLDAPGLGGVLTVDDFKDQGASYQAKFEAIVSGAKGTCKCSWQVHIGVRKNGEIAENKVTDIDCAP